MSFDSSPSAIGQSVLSKRVSVCAGLYEEICAEAAEGSWLRYVMRGAADVHGAAQLDGHAAKL